MLDSSRFSATTRLVGGSFTFSGELAALSSGITYPQGSEQQLNRLAEYATKLGVIDKLTPYLEVLV